MTDIISNVMKPGVSVEDTCAGTFYASIACMLLPKHKTYIGWEKNSVPYTLFSSTNMQLRYWSDGS